MEELKRLLEDLHIAVKQMQERMDLQSAQILSYESAAKLMDISPSTVKRMVKSGELLTCKRGGRPAIPMSEIQRLAQAEAPRPRRGGGRPRAAPHDWRAEAAKAREDRKKRR